MLYTEEMVRQNLRNRDGKRVFYLGKGDTLTPGARDWLTKERISLLPAELAKPEAYRLLNGAVLTEKPEQNGCFAPENFGIQITLPSCARCSAHRHRLP